VAWQGEVGSGSAWCGEAREPMAHLQYTVGSGMAGRGEAGSGLAREPMAHLQH